MNARVNVARHRLSHPAPMRHPFMLTRISAAAFLFSSTVAAAANSDPNQVDTLAVAQVPPPVTEVAATDNADSSFGTAEIAEVQVHSTRGRTIESVKDTPKSISVVEGIELDRLAATDIPAILQRAGNVKWNSGNARTSSLSIRGLGRQAQTDAMDPSVGMVVDGLAYAYNPLSAVDFTDVESVEVARGPQGTLYGKNATVGIINIETRRPTFAHEGNFSLALGQNDRVIGSAAVGGPVIDDLLAWRGTFSVDKGDGDYANNYNRDFSFRNKDNVAGRVQFLLTPSENVDALLKLELQPRHGEYYNGWVFYSPTPTSYADGSPNTLTTDASTRLARRWFQQDSSYSYQNDYLSKTHVNLDAQQPLVTSSNGAIGTLNWRIPGHTVTSVTGYKEFYFQARNDEGTPFDVSKNGGGHVNYRQASEELRLTSAPGGFVDYQTGIYLLRSANDYDSGAGYGSDAGAWFASKAQYDLLDADSNGRYLLENSLNGLNVAPLQKIDNKTAAVFGQADWHLSDALTLTTGLRFQHENRSNTVSKLVYENGYGAELNPVSVNGVDLGGFASDSNGGLTTNTPEQLALADATALKYFGVVGYGNLTNDQKKQVATAKAIRSSQIGLLWNGVKGEPFRKTQPGYVISPSYKFNEQVTSYVSYQYGEKAGIALVTNGVSTPAKAEKNSSYELGVKTSLLDGTLTFNADVFFADIKNYQQAVFIEDVYTTGLNRETDPASPTVYISQTGNVPKVRSRGVEIDGAYSGIPYTSLRFSLAYNDAYYKKFPNLGQPPENGNLSAKYRDVSGESLPGAAKWTGNLGADYRLPIFNSKELHASANYAYTSRYNSDVTLSSYGWTSAYGVLDLGLGLGSRDGSFEATILAKNALDQDESEVKTWNSYVPYPERWIGVVFSGKF